MAIQKNLMNKFILPALMAAAGLVLCAGAYGGELAACFTEAAKKYHINRTLLIAIAKHESNFDQYAVHRNKDGTYDYGLMQINYSIHQPTLKKLGVGQKDLFDGCTNIYVGAMILHKSILTHGETWRAVGAYNANGEEARKRYVKKIQYEYARLSERMRS